MPLLEEALRVVGVDDRGPARAERLRQGVARVVHPALVEVGERAAGVGGPHELGHGVGEALVAALGQPAQLGDLGLAAALLGLAQELGLADDLLAAAVELDEDLDLGADDVGIDRLQDVVDGPDLVAAVDALDVLDRRREEDDRDVLAADALLDQPRDLEAVHLRHRHVEQDGREAPAEHAAQGLGARAGLDQGHLGQLEG